MLTFVGQVKAQLQIEKLFVNGLPALLIINAPKRYGKKTFVNFNAHRLNVPVITVNGTMDAIRDAIQSSYTLAEPCIFLIEDAEELNTFCQNALLKVTEEPPKNAYFFLTVKNLNTLLPTLYSRSKCITLSPYSRSVLNTFTDKVELIDATSSPGQIKLLDEQWEKQKELVLKIIQNIKRISAANTFNILNHIKDDEYESFFIVFRFFYMEDALSTNLNMLPHLARIFNKFDSLFQIKSLNKRNLFELLFLDIREVTTYGVL